MAKKTQIKPADAVQPPQAVNVRVALDVPDGTLNYYANYFEITHTKWDFSLIAVKLPPKISVEKAAEVGKAGVLNLSADFTISVPSTLVVGLIRALETQKEKFEKETGTKLEGPKE